MTPTPQDIAGDVIRRCLSHGFAQSGVCRPGPITHAAELRAWVDAGKHGSMSWFPTHLNHRVDPGGLLNGCRSVIVVADLYARRGEARPEAPSGSGLIARYASGRDYHRTIKVRLKKLTRSLARDYPGHRFRPMVDIMPVHERELAARAGIGWVGKHTLIINPQLGSWFLLGCVLTTLDMDAPSGQDVHTDHCGTCTRCIDACPTAAITPYSVDARRCISYLTIERHEPIPTEFHAAIGGWIFGCDICQDVCPHNSRPPAAQIPPVHKAYSPSHSSIDLVSLMSWSDEHFERTFQGTAVRRADLPMIRRNAIVAASNLLGAVSPEIAVLLSVRIAEIASDPLEPELVRQAAISALIRIQPNPNVQHSTSNAPTKSS